MLFRQALVENCWLQPCCVDAFPTLPDTMSLPHVPHRKALQESIVPVVRRSGKRSRCLLHGAGHLLTDIWSWSHNATPCCTFSSCERKLNNREITNHTIYRGRRVMVTHQALSGSTDEEFLQRMASTYPERFGEDLWRFFTAQVAPSLPERPVMIDL